MDVIKNIELFQELVRCGNDIYTWCYDADGQLLAEVLIDGEAGEKNELTFVNTYAPPATPETGDLSDAFCGEEIECCAYYQGKLLCNTCDGSIFEIQEGLLPL